MVFTKITKKFESNSMISKKILHFWILEHCEMYEVSGTEVNELRQLTNTSKGKTKTNKICCSPNSTCRFCGYNGDLVVVIW